MWGITLGLFLLLICVWILRRRKYLSIFKELGIPGPEPSFFFGNYTELTDEHCFYVWQKWEKKYGKIFGYYFGLQPFIYVSDLDLIKKIEISDFHKFINRPAIYEIKLKKGEGGTQLINLKDKKWKDIRSIITPTFTTSKMKMMVPIINSTIDTLMEKIDEEVEKDASFDINNMYQGLTLDAIGRAAFGIQTDCQKNPDDLILKVCQLYFATELNTWIFKLIFCFPEFWFLMEKVMILSLTLKYKMSNPVKALFEAVRQIIKERRANTSRKRQDLLQLMIDAELPQPKMNEGSNGMPNCDETFTENQISRDSGIDTNQTEKQTMDDDEIVDNAQLFLIAGYETTSSTLGFITHFLINHPDVQEKVRDEVNDLEEKEGRLDYYAVHQLPYLDQVISESLRIYPPIFMFVNREVGEDVNLDGFHINKGMAIQIPTYSLHHNEEYWDEPERFDPERFSPENKNRISNMAYQPFGAGPRNCVGMRFALMEIKFALARILRKYRLSKCDETNNHSISLKVSFGIMSPKNGVYVKATRL